jgi:hypothetical protein
VLPEPRSALPEPRSALLEPRSAFPGRRSALPGRRSALPGRRSALPERRSESRCPEAVRYAARVAHPSRGPQVAAEFELAELRRAVRPVPKVIAWRRRVVAEAAVAFESAEQRRVAGSMPEATV